MRHALVLPILVLAGCGASTPAARDSVVPPNSTQRSVTAIAGTEMSPQEVADQAAGVPLHGEPRPEFVPLPQTAFDRPIARYRAYSEREAAAMAGRVDALRRALRASDRPAARRAWAGAYERYLLIGAAYGALGDLDAAITKERQRIERGLWTGEPLRALDAPAARLAGHVRELRRTVGAAEIAPLDYATRAHEILEDAQRELLSGAAAPWSGAGVRATAASLRATDVVIGTLRPLLAERGALAPVELGLLGLRRELAAIRRAHGGWPELDALTRAERQRLTGRLGAGLESLARVPGALETAYPPAIPEIK